MIYSDDAIHISNRICNSHIEYFIVMQREKKGTSVIFKETLEKY